MAYTGDNADMTMTPHVVYDTVTDQYGQPIAAAQVAIRDEDGALVDLAEGNPLITDATGLWSAVMLPGTYTLVISKGDDFISRTLEVCQNVERTPFIAQIDEVNLPIVLDSVSCDEVNTPTAISIVTIISV
jgi:hypothetical protein